MKRRQIRRRRIRVKIKKKSHQPRLSVFRSHHYLWAQIIDDQKGKTLVSASDKELMSDKKPAPTKKGIKDTKTDRARLVGQLLAQKALKKGIKQVVFDRGPYQYHGRVKALVEGARKGGLKF